MTPPDVGPALSAEEWQEIQRRNGIRLQFEYWGDLQLHSTGELTVRDTINHPAIFKGADKHRLAALALYDSPFGFSHQDVQALRDASRSYWGSEKIPPGGYEAVIESNETIAARHAALRSIAARISNLLPPEGP